MIECQVDVVSAVIFIWKAFAVVYSSCGKLTVTLSQGICQPSRCLSYGFLRHELYTHRAAVSHLHFVLPSGRRTEKADTVFVLEYIFHSFIVSFY